MQKENRLQEIEPLPVSYKFSVGLSPALTNCEYASIKTKNILIQSSAKFENKFVTAVRIKRDLNINIVINIVSYCHL